MYEGKELHLPNGLLGYNRHMEVGFSHHGDIQINYWVGDRCYDHEAAMFAPKGISFPMAHSSESVVLAAMVGYYKRLGTSQEHIRAIFHDVARPVLEDVQLQHDARLRDNYRQMYLDDIMEGESIPVYDQPYHGWDSLVYPIPCQPGVIESVGGIGLYTRTDLFGNFNLVMAQLPGISSLADPAERPPAVEFSEPDIRLLAGALCENSMGEYRRDIYNLVSAL